MQNICLYVTAQAIFVLKAILDTEPRQCFVLNTFYFMKHSCCKFILSIKKIVTFLNMLLFVIICLEPSGSADCSGVPP